MEVSEIIRLANWLEQNTIDVEPDFSALVAVLQNNAQQSAQQRVQEPLNALSKSLDAMRTIVSHGVV